MSATDRAGLALLDASVGTLCPACFALPGYPCSGGVAHAARVTELLAHAEEKDLREAKAETFPAKWRRALASEWPTPKEARVFPMPSAEDLEWIARQNEATEKATKKKTTRKKATKAPKA